MTMRNKLLSAFTSLLLLVAIAILGSGAYRQSQLNNSSREFAIEVTPLILRGSPLYEAQEDLEDAPEIPEPPTAAQTLASFSHRELLERQSMDDLDKYLYTVTLNLGPLQVVQSISGGSEASLSIFDDRVPSAAYELEVEFARGTAQVLLEMLLEQGEWQITSFSVQTELLAD